MERAESQELRKRQDFLFYALAHATAALIARRLRKEAFKANARVIGIAPYFPEDLIPTMSCDISSAAAVFVKIIFRMKVPEEMSLPKFDEIVKWTKQALKEMT